MSNTIQLKRSATAGKIPLITDVELGELAMNTADGKLFMKKKGTPNTIVEIGGGGDDTKVAKAGDTMTGNLAINTVAANNFSLTSPIGKSIAMGIEGSGPEFSIVGSSTTPYTITSYDSSSTIQSALAFKTNGNLGLTNLMIIREPLHLEQQSLIYQFFQQHQQRQNLII
jgi:hypothetical protein